MKSPGEFKTHIEHLASLIEIPAELLPSFGKFTGQRTYIYIEGDSHHWVAHGDTPNPSDIAVQDEEELLYLVFESLTRQMGLIHEVLHRNPNRDNRRLAYIHQLELLQKLNPAWKDRRHKEITEELKWYPYKDDQR